MKMKVELEIMWNEEVVT